MMGETNFLDTLGTAINQASTAYSSTLANELEQQKLELQSQNRYPIQTMAPTGSAGFQWTEPRNLILLAGAGVAIYFIYKAMKKK